MCCCSDSSCNCGCCSGGHKPQRRFYTKEEKIEQLEAYIEELENELKGARRQLEAVKEEEASVCC